MFLSIYFKILEDMLQRVYVIGGAVVAEIVAFSGTWEIFADTWVESDVNACPSGEPNGTTEDESICAKLAVLLDLSTPNGAEGESICAKLSSTAVLLELSTIWFSLIPWSVITFEEAFLSFSNKS